MLPHADALNHLVDQTALLRATLEELAKDDDVGHPSLCRGWTRGHVVAHLARNADGITNLVRAAHGEPLTMYLSPEARDADIDSGALRPARDNLSDASTAADAVVAALSTLTPDLLAVPVERTPGVAFGFAGTLAHRRLREVAYHHVDLDAGFTFADLPDELQVAFLHEEVDLLPSHDRASALLRLARGIPPSTPTEAR